jgi:hypothetical protein
VREYRGVIETNVLDGNTTPKRGFSNTSACAVRKINNKIIQRERKDDQSDNQINQTSKSIVLNNHAAL